MSRSHKHVPLFKGGGRESSTKNKLRAARKVRQSKTDLPPKGSFYKRLYKQLNMYDYKIGCRWKSFVRGWEHDMNDLHASAFWREHCKKWIEKKGGLRRHWRSTYYNK